MKTFKQIIEEKQQLSEGGEMYPADDMTMKELKIACYAAEKILERLEGGASIQRWQISAIVKASEELASVYTSLSVDDDEEQAAWDDEEMWGDEDDGAGYYDDLYYDEFGNAQSYYESKAAYRKEEDDDDEDDEDDDEDEKLQIWRDDKTDRIMDKSMYKFKGHYPKSFQTFESKKAKAKK